MNQPEAAVALVKAQKPEPAVLLMRRAERDGDPWSGHWSFPGGHIEPQDVNLLQTALRELREECGVHLTEQQLRGALPDATARRKGSRSLVVSPFVFALLERAEVAVDLAEAIEGRWVPLSMLEDPAHHHLRAVPGMPPHILFPSVDLPVVPLWGFTYRLVTEWLQIAPTAEASRFTAEDLLAHLASLGVRACNGWHGREVLVGGSIPVEPVIEYLAGRQGKIPAVNAVDVQPDVVRVVGLSFEEYLIRANSIW
jgi:8-oxo-dGTP pyrophosphatase MutT (NUDIX family)